MIDVSKTIYDVVITLPDGDKLKLNTHNKIVEDLTWEDMEGQIAQKMTLRVPQVKIKDKNITSFVKLCCPVAIYANSKKVFDGLFWEMTFDSSLTSKEMTFIAYDKTIYANNSEGQLYFSKNKTTKYIIQQICKKCGMSCNYKWTSIKHKKILFSGDTYASMIQEVIELAEKQKGKTAVVLWRNGKLEVNYKGNNKDVYFIGDKTNTISSSRTWTLDGLVTKVIILGKENKKTGLSSVSKTLTKNLKYGTLTKIVKQNDSEKKAASAEAKEILKENGSPKKTIQLSCADVPFIRKGDKIRCDVGNIEGYYYVKSVQHNATDRRMDLEIEVVS